MVRGYLKNNKGFSLLESILTITILSAGFLAFTMSQQNTLVNSVNRDLGVIASSLANERLETIIADNEFMGYDYASDSENYPIEVMDGDFSGFTRKIVMTEVNPDDLTEPQEGSGLSKIDVEVKWGTEVYQIVKMTTIVAKVN